MFVWCCLYRAFGARLSCSQSYANIVSPCIASFRISALPQLCKASRRILPNPLRRRHVAFLYTLHIGDVALWSPASISYAILVLTHPVPHERAHAREDGSPLLHRAPKIGEPTSVAR